MRKLVILPSIALACAATMVASPRQALIPGFGRSAIERQKVSRFKPMSKSVKRQALPKNFVSAPKRMSIGRSEAETRKVLRMVGYDAKLGNYQYSLNREYDQYGFPSRETQDNGYENVYDYSWITPGYIWSSKTVTTYLEGRFERKESEERTFHANGSVASRTVSSTDSNKMYYEYTPDGYLVMSQDPENGFIERWTLLPGIGQWIHTQEYPDYKEVITLDGDYGYTFEIMALEDNVWKTRQKEGRWYDADKNEVGYMYVSYGMNPQGVWAPVGADGNRTVTYDNGTTREVVSERIEFDGEQSSYRWIPQSKSVSSSNFEDPWKYSEGQVRTCSSYRYEDGQWIKYSDETYFWVNPKVVKDVYVDYVYDEPMSVSYYMPDQVSGDELGNDIYYDESTGNYAINTYDDNYEYYTYYDAQGNVVSRYRENNDSDYSISRWSVWNGNDWVKCTGTHTIYEDSDDRYVITFDDMGRPVIVEDYEEGLLDCREEYEYTADGYVRRDYVPEYQGPVYLESVSEFTRDANGVTVEKFTEYDHDGSITYCYGEKYVPSTGIHYRLEYADGQWIETPSWVDEIIETLADGTEIRISRGIDENGNIVNDRKEVNLNTPTYERHENYSWNADLNMWIGNWKNERSIADTTLFPMIEPTDPAAFYDEYFKPVSSDEDGYEEPESSQTWYDASYQWDYENNTGWFCFQALPEFTYPDKNTKIKVIRLLDGSVTEKWTTNDNRYQTGYYLEHADTAGQLINQESHTWEYDDQNNLTKDTETRSDGEVWSYTYRYGNIDVVGIEDIMVSGQDKPFDVYNLQGICVLRNADPEALRTLPRGIYIANGRKIAVR